MSKMKRLIKPHPWQAVFLLLPHLRSFAGLALFFFLITACPDPPETTDCGVHQIEVNGDCECEEGYHWNEDQTKCLMDTTSHNFVWEVDTLGDYGSYLNDVAIIDENNIWVVGNIETDSMEYNVAHWNGKEWKLIQIERPVDFDGVFGFSNNNIWFSDGCYIYLYDGSDFIKQWECDWDTYGTGQVKKIWGTSSSNIYFVGNSGSIVHYDGNTFTRIESEMDIPIVDVWGRDENDIFFCQFNSTTGHSGILHYDGNQLESLYYFESIVQYSDTLSGAIHTIWIYEDTLYAGYSSGIWKENILEKKGVVTFWTKIFNENIYSNKIIGQSNSDIFIVGNWMKMAHFNGVSWKSYANIFGNYGTYEAVDLSGNLVCVVGWTDFPKALIVVGKRVMD